MHYTGEATLEKSIKPQYNRSFIIYFNVSIEDIQIQNYL